MVSLREKVDVGVENISVVVSETFYYLPEWVRKTTEGTEGTEKNNNSLCPPCPLWLIFFAIIRVHPEKIKKSLVSALKEINAFISEKNTEECLS